MKDKVSQRVKIKIRVLMYLAGYRFLTLKIGLSP